MSGKPAPLTVVFDLLVRFTDVEKLITWTDREGNTQSIVNAVPRQFAPIVGPFPMMLNWVSHLFLVHEYQQATDYDLSITIQVIGGPLGSGYSGESEDRLNMMYMALSQTFEQNPFLKIAGVPFDYIKPKTRGVTPREAPIGTSAFEVNDGQAVTRYMAFPLICDVSLWIPRQRIG